MHHPFWREFWWRTIEGEGWLGGRGARPDSRYATAEAEGRKVRELLSERGFTAFAGHTHTCGYDGVDWKARLAVRTAAPGNQRNAARGRGHHHAEARRHGPAGTRSGFPRSAR